MKTIPRIRAAIDAARVNMDEPGQREGVRSPSVPRRPTEAERARWLRDQLASTQRTMEELQALLEDYRTQLRQLEQKGGAPAPASGAGSRTADKSAVLQDKGREKLSELKSLFDDF